MWKSLLLLRLILLFHSVHCLTSPSPPSCDVLSNQVSQLQKEVSDLRGQFQTQEKKYSALLSTVISRMSSSTHALDTVKAEVNSLKSDQLETRTELKNATEDITLLKLNMLQNEKSIHSLQQNVTECATCPLNQTEMTKLEIGVMKANVSELILKYGQTVDKLSSVESEMGSLQSNLTNEIEMMHYLNFTLSEAMIRRMSENCTEATNGNGAVVLFEADSAGRSHIQGKTVLQFTRVHSNIGNAFNPSTGIFTAQIPGVYMFWMTVGGTSTTNANIFIQTPKYTVYSHDGLYEPVADSKRFVVNFRRQFAISRSTAVLLRKGGACMG